MLLRVMNVFSSLPRGGRPLGAAVVCGLAIAIVSGCTGPVQQEQQVQARHVQQDAASAAAAERALREQQRREGRQNRIDALLAAADAALEAHRLTLPVHDNAYDRYQGVLLLAPDNVRAQSGLDSVLLAYVDLIRSALRRNQAAEASRLLAQARDYYGDNPLLAEMDEAIVQAREKARRQLELLGQQEVVGQEFELPAADLSRKSEKIRAFLVKVAQRLRETDESVLIVAPTDAQGRWIYKQMKEAVPDYRIRGDIRLSPTPGLKLLPPL